MNGQVSCDTVTVDHIASNMLILNKSGISTNPHWIHHNFQFCGIRKNDLGNLNVHDYASCYLGALIGDQANTKFFTKHLIFCG